jgi:hypothetical protein
MTRTGIMQLKSKIPTSVVLKAWCYGKKLPKMYVLELKTFFSSDSRDMEYFCLLGVIVFRLMKVTVIFTPTYVSLSETLTVINYKQRQDWPHFQRVQQE